MKKLTATTLAAALLAAGCSSIQTQPAPQSVPAPGSPVAEAGCPLAPERPVDNSKKAIGAGVGAVAGALIGNATGGKNTVIGAGLGGLFGYLVGSEIAVREQRDGSVMLDIPGAALFDTDKTAIKPKFASTLDQISATLRDNPGTIVCIIGYTDSTGSSSYNANLSVRRAESVREFLERKGIQGNRLTAAGLGERFPVASNSTESGRTQNRRVEMYVRR
ncbi:OmpA family protein [Limnobacter sp.]|uniref:OmpA family protein n=1 Tax=Limnobacter sp. TaxID=2003368 RepID=UPI002583BDE3|nr:OmpA family protein [Limnobacter sp.]